MKTKLLTYQNPKTIKGIKLGYLTFILHLAPNTLNSYGKNLCPMATKGCIRGCLNTAGMGGIYKTVQDSRKKKSDYFISDRTNFLNDLYEDIKIAIKIAENKKLIPAFRLNGTSDIQWENIIIKDNKNIFELFPDQMFYDYTKIVNRFDKKLPSNYNLTFSYSLEEDYYKGNVNELTKKVLNMGYNVAVIFYKNIPETFLGYTVINGDETDLRFIDKGIIVGLNAKGRAQTDKTGFVVRL